MRLFRAGFLLRIYPNGLRYEPTLRKQRPRPAEPFPPPHMKDGKLIGGQPWPGRGVYRREDGTYYTLRRESGAEISFEQAGDLVSELGTAIQRMAHLARRK